MSDDKLTNLLNRYDYNDNTYEDPDAFVDDLWDVLEEKFISANNTHTWSWSQRVNLIHRIIEYAFNQAEPTDNYLSVLEYVDEFYTVLTGFGLIDFKSLEKTG